MPIREKYLFRHTFCKIRHFKRYKIRHFVVVFFRHLRSKIRHLKRAKSDT